MGRQEREARREAKRQRKLERKMARKRRGHPILLLLFFVLLIFLFFVFLPLDDEDLDNYEEGDKEVAVTDEETTYEAEDTSKKMDVLYDNGAIREHLVKLKGKGQDTVTIMVYMNGSNLESDDSQASKDLLEMVNAGDSDKVNIVVQTMGTKKWNKKFGIASDRSQIYTVNGNGLNLVKDDLGQLDCTKKKTLSTFIKWSASNYPADRYMLVFWDHGGGPVYGYGYDEWSNEEGAALTLDEIQGAMKDAGVIFDMVGMDCCIMSCMEVACALYDYCDYMILSEDFESGLGWSYTKWLKQLYKNTSIDTVELGKTICDTMVSANETTSGGDKAILAVVDESMMKVLFTAWTDFAYANQKTLLGTNYSEEVEQKEGGRILPRMKRGILEDLINAFTGGYDMADYFVTDILAVAQNIYSDESTALSAAVSQALVYVKSTSSDSALTGMSVTLPYGDSNFYAQLKGVFNNVGIDGDYVKWLGKFANVSSDTDSYDYDGWDGWDDVDEDELDDFDWDDWEYSEEENYWDDDMDWCDEFDYEDSFNSWFDLFFGDYEDDGYQGDDYYYDDYEEWGGDERWTLDDWLYLLIG